VREPGAARHFRYATRILPGLSVDGVGVFAGERWRRDGSRTSALRFRGTHQLSPIGAGSGYWRYQPTESGVRFLTGYDYRPAWGRAGRAADLVVRPLMGWATAWSFDRLRLWLERGVTPRRALHHAVIEVVVRASLPVLVGVAAPAPVRVPVTTILVVAAALIPPLPDTPAARRCQRKPAAPNISRPPSLLTTLKRA